MTGKINGKPRRSVVARRTIALGVSIATATLGAGATAAQTPPKDPNAVQGHLSAQDSPADLILVSGGEGGEGGEGEGEGATPLAPGIALLRDLGFIEGHLRAGLALYEAGDLVAAKTHMGHPIKEKYDAVSEPMAERGQGQLRDQLVTLAGAAEAELAPAQLLPLFEAVQTTINSVRGELTVHDQLMALSALTRIAADEYSIAVEADTMSNLHEYQDSWGFLQVVKTQAESLSESKTPPEAAVAARVLVHLSATDSAFGDIQGQGTFEMNPSLIYGAAARMELAAIGLK